MKTDFTDPFLPARVTAYLSLLCACMSFQSVSGCSSDDSKSASSNAGSSGAARNGSSTDTAGTSASSNEEGEAGNAGAPADGSAAGAADTVDAQAGSGGAAGEAALGGSSNNGGSGGSSNSSANICTQVVTYLTSCGQSQGAHEGSQNCNPDNPLSQCVVACLLLKPCTELTDWPTPIEGCVSDCTANL